ncbi:MULTISPECIES: GNAT family N-acetyltransferase [Bordetella]|uniref:GNAT family N-acetyltransferase n=1 Tax=Bordetella genomosp. 6 TaxID=463024 RepID=A0ABX4FM70_9BORD|nr:MULTISPECIES: GNAT family N-acetyltransferase [Bordetella]OZI81377.1 GNAT family N-acetyltransferase [Bordetella genomosp. 6]
MATLSLAMPSSSVELSVQAGLDHFDAAQWDALAGAQPFVRHAFLRALHDTGCAHPGTGWTPCFLALRRDGRLAGAVPLYAKSHSRGEYVFDHAWADAYARNGLPYYPKLLSAVPFTPVGGARLLAHTHADRLLLARGLIQLARQFEVSSLHVLFPSDDDLLALREAGYLIRAGVQFHWRNAGYAGFDDFLGAFSHDKRKKIRQDRKKVAAERVSFRWLRGADIDAAALDFFYQCYRHTYLAHGNPPYLNPAFFRQLHAEMPDALVLILAEQDGQPVAAALNLQADGVLYGRYWGARRYIPGLHFETCYLQSIEYCIAHGLTCFEGGAQGEHKVARGLLPTPTWSAHWIADTRFAAAIDDFLGHETHAIDEYRDELATHSPFRKT